MESNTKKPLFLIVGKSGSGKSYLVDKICSNGVYTSVESFTTRPKRYDNERGHIFLQQSEFDKIRKDLVAYTMFNNYEYGVTLQEIQDNDFYIIDENGINELLRSRLKINRPIIIIYVKSNLLTRITRMKQRGDSIFNILKRVWNDMFLFSNLLHDNNINYDYIIHNNKYFIKKSLSENTLLLLESQALKILEYIISKEGDNAIWLNFDGYTGYR